MNYIKQIIFELKTQKMVAWISISGTALAIFMVMTIYLAGTLYNLEMAPASNRHRILMGQGMHTQLIDGKGMTAANSMSQDLALNIYGNLDGIEKISLMGSGKGADASIKNGSSISVQTLAVDDEFWKIYDYKFISGKPFDKGDIESGNNLIIVRESVARALFNDINVVGETIDINNIPYIVRGVVEDSFMLLSDGTVNIFTNYNPSSGSLDFGDGILGPVRVIMLMKKGVDPDYIKQQVSKKFEDANRIFSKSNREMVYHLQPYTSEEINTKFGNTSEPDLKKKKKEDAIIYTLLLLLPAINLSNMTRSRLIHRVTEIGVRRAFGAKRISIITQIFSENLLMTFIGGCLGLCLSFLFLIFLSGYFMPLGSFDTFLLEESSKVSSVIWHLFNFKVFFIALGACLILNVLSATLPSWKASLMQPATAISKSRQ